MKNACFKEVRNLKVPATTKVFGWRVLLDCFPSRGNIKSRGVWVSCNLCPLCNKEVETTYHILIDFDVVQRIWAKCDKWVGLTSVRNNTITNHFCSFYLSGLSNKHNYVCKEMWLAIGKAICTQRNKIIFKDGQVDEIALFTLAQLHAWS